MDFMRGILPRFTAGVNRVHLARRRGERRTQPAHAAAADEGERTRRGARPGQPVAPATVERRALGEERHLADEHALREGRELARAPCRWDR